MKIAGCVIQNRNIIESNQHTFHAIYKGRISMCPRFTSLENQNTIILPGLTFT